MVTKKSPLGTAIPLGQIEKIIRVKYSKWGVKKQWK